MRSVLEPRHRERTSMCQHHSGRTLSFPLLFLRVQVCLLLHVHDVDLTRGPLLALSSPRSTFCTSPCSRTGTSRSAWSFWPCPFQPTRPCPCPPPCPLSPSRVKVPILPHTRSQPPPCSPLHVSPVHSIPRSRSPALLIHPLDGLLSPKSILTAVARSRPAATILSVRVEPVGK